MIAVLFFFFFFLLFLPFFFSPSCICIRLCVLWIPMSIRGVCNFRSLVLLDLSAHCMASALIRVTFFLGQYLYLQLRAPSSKSLNDILHDTTSFYLHTFYFRNFVFSDTRLFPHSFFFLTHIRRLPPRIYPPSPVLLFLFFAGVEKICFYIIDW